MTVQNVIDMAVNAELKQLSVSDITDTANIDVIISYINLAVIELHKRFDIKIDTEVVATSSVVPVYNLRNPNVLQILSVYDSYGKELTAEEYIDYEDYDIKLISFNTFLLASPKDETLIVVYKATPARVANTTDEIYLSDAYLEPLLHYIGYTAHAAQDGAIQAENNTHYMRFEKSCKWLVDNGYSTYTSNATYSSQNKGFV